MLSFLAIPSSEDLQCQKQAQYRKQEARIINTTPPHERRGAGPSRAPVASLCTRYQHLPHMILQIIDVVLVSRNFYLGFLAYHRDSAKMGVCTNIQRSLAHVVLHMSSRVYLLSSGRRNNMHKSKKLIV